MLLPYARRRFSADRGLLACCAGAGFATLLDSAVVTYAVPSLGTGLHASGAGVQWFLAVYSLTFGLGLVPGGRLGDAFGRRGPFLAGLALFALGALAATTAAGIGWAVGARAVQGLGAGLISAQVLGLIQDRFTGVRRVRALAAYSGAGAVAAVAGPLGAALLLAVLPGHLAWRAVLALNLPFVLAVGLLTLRYVPRTARPDRRPELDLPAVALVGALVLLATAPVIGPGAGPGPVVTVVACAVLVVVTVLRERRYAARGRTPLFVPALMRSRGFVTGNLIALLWFGSMIAHMTAMTIYLLQGRGWSPLLAAAVVVPGSLARIAASSTSSRVFGRLGVRTLPVMLLVQLAGMLLLVPGVRWADGAGLVAWIVAVEVVVGAAAATFEPPLRAVTLGFAPAGNNGVAASFLQLSQRLSATFCVALVAGVLFAGDRVAVSTGGLVHGMLLCCGLIAVACLLALAPSLRGPHPVAAPAVDPAAAPVVDRPA